MEFIIGIDLGTSSLKSVLYNKKGQKITSSSQSYPIFIKNTGYSEQNPKDWFNATINTITNIINEVPEAKKNTKAIALSGQMHSLVLLDKENKVIRDAILWNDVRTTEEVEDINRSIDVIDITQNKALEGFTLPKLLWVKKHEPHNYKKIDTFLLPKDYIVYKLTDQKVMDYSDASGTLMLDFSTNNWSQNIFDTFEINEQWAPTLKWATDYVGDLTSKAKEILGFKNDVKVFAGAADNAAAALASGITNENTALVSIGTSGVFLSPEHTNSKKYKGKIHYFNHAIKDTYYSMGVTISAGKSLEWIKNVLDKNSDYLKFLKNIDTIDPGSNGLLFSPYIMGERTPYTDSKIRGSFIGLDVTHTKDHIAKSVLEGIVYSLKDSMEIMTSLDKKIENIISVGGGAKNNNWIQIQADIFGVPITTLTNEEGPAQGAAMIAAIGLNWFANHKDCIDAFVKFNKTVYPNEEHVQLYKKYYSLYSRIYQQTVDLSHELHKLK